MSPAPITSHISQPSNVIPHLPLRIVLNRHIRQFRSDLRNGALWDVPDFGKWVDGEFGDNAV